VKTRRTAARLEARSAGAAERQSAVSPILSPIPPTSGGSSPRLGRSPRSRDEPTGNRVGELTYERAYMPTWLLIVIIVVVVLALFGFFGRGRFSR
jgi:hypothetical protein